ncbi:hypothetical protein NL676_018299 [Syzygium grande]|nr:hypothetical protein NL676_018299 [Syzygium grande]
MVVQMLRAPNKPPNPTQLEGNEMRVPSRRVGDFEGSNPSDRRPAIRIPDGRGRRNRLTRSVSRPYALEMGETTGGRGGSKGPRHRKSTPPAARIISNRSDEQFLREPQLRAF